MPCLQLVQSVVVNGSNMNARISQNLGSAILKQCVAIVIAVLLGIGVEDEKALRASQPAIQCARPISRIHSIRRRCSHDVKKGSIGKEWIAGTWLSHRLDINDFVEWEGTVQIELEALSSRRINLYLIAADGARSSAPDGWPGRMGDDTIFFGPIGSGLRFHYRRDGDVLILDLEANDASIHAELNRKKR